METETNNNITQAEVQSHRLDASAIEALSAGIGLGRLVNNKKQGRTSRPSPAPQPTLTTKTMPKPTVPKVRFGFVRSVLAWCCDLLIIIASLLMATTAAHYATTSTLPVPADVLFALSERFAAHEVALVSAVLMSAYFILFKLLTGFTLGEAMLGAKRR